jgi:protocatechuate 3,4-dioxygenase beta subunit
VVPAAIAKPADKPSEPESLEPGTVAGVVLDSIEQPVQGATVRVVSLQTLYRPESSFAIFSAQTDAEGNFAVKGLPARTPFVITAESEGYYCPSHPSFQLKPGETVSDARLVLSRGTMLRGRLLGRNGKPVAGALVVKAQERGTAGWNGSGINLALTDDSGRFNLAYREECTAVLRVLTLKEGVNLFTVEVQENTPVDLKMPAPSTLSGKVTLADGKPPELVVVSLDATTKDCNRSSAHFAARTEADGSYTFESLPPDATYTAVVVEKSGKKLTNSLTVGLLAEGEAKSFDIRLGSPARVRGTVVGERTGRPQKRARIGWVGEHGSDEDAVRTDENGAYELEFYEPGKYVIYAMPAAGDWNKDCKGKYGREVNVTADAEQQVDFRLPDAFSLGIRVVDGHGKPVPDAEVVAAFEKDETGVLCWGPRNTDGEGRCRYEELPPGHTAWLTVSKEERTEVRSRNYSANGSHSTLSSRVTGEPGVDYPEETVVLYGASTLKGVALGTDGQPLANRGLVLQFEMPSIQPDGTPIAAKPGFGQVETGADGAFALEVPATALSSVTLCMKGDDASVCKANVGDVDCQVGQVTDLGRLTFELDPRANMGSPE